MSHVLIALILFALGAYTASVTRDGYKDGVMPALVSSRVAPLRFDRIQAPAWLWGAAALNGAVALLLIASGGIVLAGSMPR